MDAVVLQKGEGRKLSLGSVQIVVLEDGTHTRGTMGIAEFTVAPHGMAPPPHVHYAHEEGFYVLEGELEFLVGTEAIRVGQGGFVMVPIGAIHAFHNPADKPARFLNTFTPPQYIGYFEEVSTFAQTGKVPDARQLAEFMSHYNTDVIF